MTVPETATAEELVAGILREGAGRTCLTCSFQAEDMVVLHMALQHQPDLPVLFLETGYHFPETIEYRDRLADLWNLNLISLQAKRSVAEQESEFGILNQSNPTQCCQLRKVEPLLSGLEPYDFWLTGLRREQSPTRANLAKVTPQTLPSGRSLLKVSPLADWVWKDVWKYAVAHDIEYLPLYDQGYTSIGCAPCTAKPAAGQDARSGRWGGKKLECGIHTFSATQS